MSRRQNNLQYGTLSSKTLITYTVQEEPGFLRRMREGFTTEDNNKAAEKRRRRGSEIIDEDEAPQVVIQEKDKEKINAAEARAFVEKKAGVTVQRANDQTVRDETKAAAPMKAKEENVSLGMRKKRKNEGVKRAGEEREEGKGETKETRKNGVGKKDKAGQRKEKRLKLSFEEDE